MGQDHMYDICRDYPAYVKHSWYKELTTTGDNKEEEEGEEYSLPNNAHRLMLLEVNRAVRYA